MDNYEELNINSLNNTGQHNIQLSESILSENSEQITSDKLQYEYLKELNKNLTLFKKKDESGKKKEENKQTMRR